MPFLTFITLHTHYKSKNTKITTKTNNELMNLTTLQTRRYEDLQNNKKKKKKQDDGILYR